MYNLKRITGIFILLIVLLASCDKFADEDVQVSDKKQFYDKIGVDNNQVKYSIGDTIWFSANFDGESKDGITNEYVSLENQTFILHGMVNLLKREFDSLSFVYQNFDLVEDIGEVQLINVINVDQSGYSFDIKFGRPLESNNLRFGLIANYPGIFASDFSAWVYYGSERNDFNDFSTDNENGDISVAFSMDAINDSIYYALPVDIRYYYENYYNTSDIANKDFYFFEVSQD